MKIALLVFLPIIIAIFSVVGWGFNSDQAVVQVVRILILEVFGIPWLIVIVYPFLIFYVRKIKDKYPQEIVESAKWHLNFSLAVLFVLLSKVIGISFSFELGNAIAVIVAIVCLGALIGFASKIKLQYLGMSVKWLLIIGGVPFVLLFGFAQLFEGLNPKSIDMGDSTFCNRADYGFVTTDSGSTYKIFKRYYFVDIVLASDRVSALYNTNRNSEAAKRCNDPFNK